MNQTPKILLVIPTAGGMHERTAAGAALLAARPDVEFITVIGRPTDYVRNSAVRVFLSHSHFTHLFFLDSDTEPPLDCLDCLLALNVPLAVGLYACPMRNGLRFSLSNRQVDHKYHLLEHLPSLTEPFSVDAAGAGCLLIRRAVLEKMDWPWFRWTEYSDGSQMSEDIYFFKQASALGYSATCDPTVECRHYKNMEITGLLMAIERKHHHVDKNQKNL